MGRLFEGITFSYQDEINKMRAAREAMKKEAEKEIEEARKEIEEARKEARKEAWKEARKEAQKEARKEIEEAQKEVETAQKEAQKEVESARRESRMMSHIYKMLIHHHSAEEIKNSLIQEFGLSEQEAGEEYQKAVE